MASSPDLTASREACRKSTQFHAKTFYFASHVLPPQKRSDAYSVYAFCRHADDRIDLAPDESTRVGAVADLKNLLALLYAPDDLPRGLQDEMPWLPAFRETIQRRQIGRNYFEDLIIGVEMDRGRVRLETWDQLDLYCYHVAAVVGLIMVHVLAEPTPELLQPARHLGTAMQLTNILRDIREDWERDRIYLPRTELDSFGVTEADIAEHRVDAHFRALMKFQIARARQFYRDAEPGIALLPKDGSQLTVRLMGTLYGAILDEIEKADYAVYRARARVSFLRKLQLAAGIYFKCPNKTGGQNWRQADPSRLG